MNVHLCTLELIQLLANHRLIPNVKYLLIYCTVYAHVDSFTLKVNNRQCGHRIMCHCRRTYKLTLKDSRPDSNIPSCK